MTPGRYAAFVRQMGRRGIEVAEPDIIFAEEGTLILRTPAQTGDAPDDRIPYNMVALPDEASFQPDVTCPYLESSPAPDSVPVATARGAVNYADQILGLKGNRTSGLPAFFTSVAAELVEGDLPAVKKDDPPHAVTEDVWFMRTELTEQGKVLQSDHYRRTIWGIRPSSLLRLLHQLLQEGRKLPNSGPATMHILSRYMNAINAPETVETS